MSKDKIIRNLSDLKIWEAFQSLRELFGCSQLLQPRCAGRPSRNTFISRFIPVLLNTAFKFGVLSFAGRGQFLDCGQEVLRFVDSLYKLPGCYSTPQVLLISGVRTVMGQVETAGGQIGKGARLAKSYSTCASFQMYLARVCCSTSTSPALENLLLW